MALSNLHTNYLTGSYQGDLLYLLKIAENNALRLNPTSASALALHVDSLNRPAIGYGYDLVANRVSAVTDLQNAGVTLSAAQIAGIGALTGSSRGIPPVLVGLALPSEAAAISLLNVSISVRQSLFNVYITSVGGLSNSRELAVLESMWYQGQDGYLAAGNQISQALIANNRAEAWFQIRYGSSKNGANGPGVVIRRFAESEYFGLDKDSSNVTAADAKQVYRMLQVHRAEIVRYEDRFGALTGAASTTYNMPVNTLINNLLPSQTALINDLRSQNPAVTVLDPNNFISTNIYLDPGKNLGAPVSTFDANHAATLNARQFNAAGSEVSFRDLLIGEGGADALEGGKGDDVLMGGTGSDIYIWKTGDGNDTIVDPDGGHLLVNGLNYIFGGGLMTKAAGANEWIDGSGKVKLTHNSPWALVLDDGSTIQLGENFDPSKWNITLRDEPIISQTYNGDQHALLDNNGNYNWAATAWAPDGSLTNGVAEASFNDVIDSNAIYVIAAYAIKLGAVARFYCQNGHYKAQKQQFQHCIKRLGRKTTYVRSERLSGKKGLGRRMDAAQAAGELL